MLWHYQLVFLKLQLSIKFGATKEQQQQQQWFLSFPSDFLCGQPNPFASMWNVSLFRALFFGQQIMLLDAHPLLML